MVKIILNREELSMVLGWIGQAEVSAEETGVPWDEFEQSILYDFKNAQLSYKENRLRLGGDYCFVCDTELKKTYKDGKKDFCPNVKCPRYLQKG